MGRETFEGEGMGIPVGDMERLRLCWAYNSEIGGSSGASFPAL